MSRTRVMIAATLFLAVTCIKFALPTTANMLRKELQTAMAPDADLRAAMTTLGVKLSGEEELISALGLQDELYTPEEETPVVLSAQPEATYSPRTLMQLREEFTEGLGKAPRRTSIEETPAPPPEPSEVPVTQMEPAVESFLASQSVFAEYALPVNVSYAMPNLDLSYVSPVSGMSSSGFGYRVHPISGDVKFHYGTDFAAWTGTEIRSFANGTVAVAGEDGGYGKYLIIDHGSGCQTLYAHCSALLVSCGEIVSAGQTIAKVGETGQVTGPHLHFELQQDGVYLNPEYYVNQMG